MGHVTLTTPRLTVICHRVLGLDVYSIIAYLCIIFDHSSFSRSRDIVGAVQNINGPRDLIAPLSRIIFVMHGPALTSVNPFTYFEVYLHPAQRYER